MVNLRKELNYYSTNTQNFTVSEWLKMLQEKNCFSPILLEAIYVLVFEMNGRGSAKQISDITGRSYQSYNLSMAPTIRRLREHGYIFLADIREENKKERYWSQFFKGGYEKNLFIWEIKDTLHTAFIKYIKMTEETGALNFNRETADDRNATEGVRRQRLHYKIERNSAIVNSAKTEFIKKNGALFCEACNFSFQYSYGINYIEAHHVLPLYMGERVTKKIDLIMLCANCHRAIHNKKWNNQPVAYFLTHMQSQLAKD